MNSLLFGLGFFFVSNQFSDTNLPRISCNAFGDESATLPSSMQFVYPALEPRTLMSVEPASSETRRPPQRER